MKSDGELSLVSNGELTFLVWDWYSAREHEPFEIYAYTFQEAAYHYAEKYNLENNTTVFVKLNNRTKQYKIKTEKITIYKAEEIKEMTNDERNSAQELYDEYRILGFGKDRALQLVRNASGLPGFVPQDKDE